MNKFTVVEKCRQGINKHISRGHRVSCQHGAFPGVGAFVASFAPAECPKGGGGVCGVYSESP